MIPTQKKAKLLQKWSDCFKAGVFHSRSRYFMRSRPIFERGASFSITFLSLLPILYTNIRISCQIVRVSSFFCVSSCSPFLRLSNQIYINFLQNCFDCFNVGVLHYMSINFLRGPPASERGATFIVAYCFPFLSLILYTHISTPCQKSRVFDGVWHYFMCTHVPWSYNRNRPTFSYKLVFLYDFTLLSDIMWYRNKTSSKIGLVVAKFCYVLSKWQFSTLSLEAS
jgi:hypothetical protein